MHAKYPLWVKVGIWGSGSRKTLIIFAWASLLFSVLNLGFAIWQITVTNKPLDERLFFFSALFLLVCLHYHFSRRWVDRHGNWTEIKSHWAKFWELILGTIVFLFIILVVCLGYSVMTDVLF